MARVLLKELDPAELDLSNPHKRTFHVTFQLTTTPTAAWVAYMERAFPKQIDLRCDRLTLLDIELIWIREKVRDLTRAMLAADSEALKAERAAAFAGERGEQRFVEELMQEVADLNADIRQHNRIYGADRL